MSLTPPAAVQLGDADVHLWTIDLDLDAAALADLRELLSPDERARADRFVVEDPRRRFVACRGRLRAIIGGYLGMRPEDVLFDYSGLGKPAVRDGSLHFNVTHSHELAAVAFCRRGELGADIEHLPRRIGDLEGLAERFFSAWECERLFNEGGDLRKQKFLRLWTCKEAILKATGKGLTFPLNQVTIDVTTDRSELVHFGDDDETIDDWTLHQFPLSEDYIGAVAAAFSLPPPQRYHWS
ncbi:MAG: 4'-phosphopantetheinyl transferase superfamily protein [Pirellulaceae bacterium]|nr:4'-phosphopantetheinyl transferase superfamily protein [Pirellulaceae bacterium]MDP7015476.1 4'-phosphopantetheinyl transferase superfamily protein [Pirellulaceae bacterium]